MPHNLFTRFTVWRWAGSAVQLGSSELFFPLTKKPKKQNSCLLWWQKYADKDYKLLVWKQKAVKCSVKISIHLHLLAHAILLLFFANNYSDIKYFIWHLQIVTTEISDLHPTYNVNIQTAYFSTDISQSVQLCRFTSIYFKFQYVLIK